MEYNVIVEGWFEKWYLNNILIKEISYHLNGQKKYEGYYLNYKFHREDGPAYQSWYSNGQKEYEVYYLDDKIHREDGPAYQSWYSNGQKRYEEYYLDGKEVSKEDVMKSNKIIIIDGKEVSKDTIKMTLRDYFK